ncbi:hypothetical protein J6590_004968 [Homalodisca vitripennis]|nr:hypothetical protein J6590_004968 [Homalodisca vitripennis]
MLSLGALIYDAVSYCQYSILYNVVPWCAYIRRRVVLPVQYLYFTILSLGALIYDAASYCQCRIYTLQCCPLVRLYTTPCRTASTVFILYNVVPWCAYIRRRVVLPVQYLYFTMLSLGALIYDAVSYCQCRIYALQCCPWVRVLLPVQYFYFTMLSLGALIYDAAPCRTAKLMKHSSLPMYVPFFHSLYKIPSRNYNNSADNHDCNTSIVGSLEIKFLEPLLGLRQYGEKARPTPMLISCKFLEMTLTCASSYLAEKN